MRLQQGDFARETVYGEDPVEAARDFGVTERQLRADLDLLWMCGLPGHTPADLIDPYIEASSRKPAVGDATVIDVRPDFRPVRARIVDDE